MPSLASAPTVGPKPPSWNESFFLVLSSLGSTSMLMTMPIAREKRSIALVTPSFVHVFDHSARAPSRVPRSNGVSCPRARGEGHAIGKGAQARRRAGTQARRRAGALARRRAGSQAQPRPRAVGWQGQRVSGEQEHRRRTCFEGSVPPSASRSASKANIIVAPSGGSAPSVTANVGSRLGCCR